MNTLYTINQTNTYHYLMCIETITASLLIVLPWKK